MGIGCTVGSGDHTLGRRSLCGGGVIIGTGVRTHCTGVIIVTMRV